MRFMNMFAKGILASMLVASFATVAVQAESDVKVTGTTDKDEYTGDEEITETVTVDNGSDVTLTDITFTGDIPEGYKAVIEAGNATEEGWSASAEAIEAGANKSVTVKFVKESAEVNPSESPEPEASPKPEETPKPEATPTPTPKPGKEGVDTSDHNNPGLWLFLFLVSIALTVALLKDRKGRKLGAFLLAAALASTTLTKTEVKAEGEKFFDGSFSVFLLFNTKTVFPEMSKHGEAAMKDRTVSGSPEQTCGRRPAGKSPDRDGRQAKVRMEAVDRPKSEWRR